MEKKRRILLPFKPKEKNPLLWWVHTVVLCPSTGGVSLFFLRGEGYTKRIQTRMSNPSVCRKPIISISFLYHLSFVRETGVVNQRKPLFYLFGVVTISNKSTPKRGNENAPQIGQATALTHARILQYINMIACTCIKHTV